MEATVVSSNGIPDEGIVSICVGGVRKQAVFAPGKPFQFLKARVDKEQLLKIDVLQQLGCRNVVLKPVSDTNQESNTYKVIFCEEPDISCELEVAPSGEPQAPPLEDPRIAKDYLEATGLPTFLQNALQAVMMEKPADPYKFMAKHFMNGYDNPDYAPASPSSLSDDPRRAALDRRIDGLLQRCAEGAGARPEVNQSKVETWSTSKWLSSLTSPLVGGGIAEVVAESLTQDLDEEEQLAFLEALGTEGDAELISRFLSRRGLLEALSEVILDGAKNLVRNRSRSRYNEEPGQALFGDFDVYYAGLDNLIGSPQPKLLEAMWQEHCSGADAVDEWTTSGHQITTSSRSEWAFVLDPDSGPGIWGEASEASLREKLAGIREAFSSDTSIGCLAGASISSSPTLAAFKEISAARHEEFCQQENERKGFAWPQEGGADDGAMHRRFPRKLGDFKDEVSLLNQLLADANQPPLLIEELIAARLFTGPMAEKYNAVLLSFSQAEPAVQNFATLCKGNSYVTTLHVINSAMLKLGTVFPLNTVFRGVPAGLPSMFWEPNVYNASGGVEFGFMGTTLDFTTASQNSGASLDAKGTVLEINLGIADRPADLAWLSQYPHREEVFFGPLTCLEVLHTYVEESVLIVECRLNVNASAPPVDRLLDRRKKMLESMIHNIKVEANQFLSLLKDEHALLVSKGIVEKPLTEVMDKKFGKILRREALEFNDDAKLKKAIDDALQVKRWIFEAQAINSPVDIQTLIGLEPEACQKGHRVRPMELPAEWPCDKCKEKFPKGCTAYKCETCFYHVCEECAVKEDLFDAALKVLMSGSSSKEPYVTLLCTRFFHSDIEKDSKLRYFIDKTLSALIGRPALVSELTAGGGGYDAVRTMFPDCLINKSFSIGRRKIGEQRLTAANLKEGGLSPNDVKSLLGLSSKDGKVLLDIGLKGKGKEKEENQVEVPVTWALGEEVVVQFPRGHSNFYKVKEIADGQVKVGGVWFNVVTGEGKFKGADLKAFSMDWA